MVKTSAKRPYSRPALIRYRPKETPAEYVIASGTTNSAKCSTDPPGCRGRGRSLIAPPPWG
jgi:hypothetical protein